MTVEVLQSISIACYILAGLLLVAMLIFFFLYDIPKVIGSLSGHTARKEIEEIRKKNDVPENITLVPELRYENRTKITDRMDMHQEMYGSEETVLLDISTEKLVDTATQVLVETQETQVIAKKCVQVEYDITFLPSKEEIM